MGENTRKDRRTKVLSMTVRYRSATLGEFIEHHSYDVSRGGMFIKTPSPFPPGTLLKFEVRIAEEQRVMQGVGRVVWKRDLDGGTPDDPAGMGIKFIKIDDASRAVIDKLVEGRPAGQDGAFEHLPDAKPRMFPSAPSPAQDTPEDPTVMKPAAELFKDALRRAGETDEVTKGSGGHEALDHAHAGSTAAAADETKTAVEAQAHSQVEDSAPQKKEPEHARSSKVSHASEVRSRDSQVRGPTERKEEEEGRGRALVSILVALLVAAAIYFVTKQGSKPAQLPAQEPPPSDYQTPPPVSPPAIVPSAEPMPGPMDTSIPFELPPVPAMDAPLGPQTEPVLVPPEEPAAVPAPVPAPKPRPAPRPNKPKPAPTPASTSAAAPVAPTPAPAATGAAAAPASPPAVAPASPPATDGATSP